MKLESKRIAFFLSFLFSIFYIFQLDILLNVPAEDAAILMRYAQNLGEGEGIVWNQGKSPVDGATDFLFLVCLSSLYRIGFSLSLGVQILCFLSHFGFAALLLHHWSKTETDLSWIIVLSLFILIGRGVYISASYFGTAFFTFWVALSWSNCLRIINIKANRWHYWWFSISCLLMGLARPEGVILSVLMLITIITTQEKEQIIASLTSYVYVFGSLGVGYFILRWYYFGYPLPNPYYVKGGGLIYWESLRASILHAIAATLPFLVIHLIILIQVGKTALLKMIPFIGGVLMWMFLSNEMNFGGRFQYPLLALLAIGWEDKVDKQFLSPFNRKTILYHFSVYLLGGLMLYFQHGRLSERQLHQSDGRESVGKILAQFSDQNYKLATTEAGLLPFYSGWPTMDTWGLNDQYIAHNPPLNTQYLIEWQPDIVCYHGGRISEKAALKLDIQGKKWQQMLDTIQHFLDQQNYCLISAYGKDSSDLHFYYINPQNPDSELLTHAIRTIDYRWFESGEISRDFR
ncbi:MAG: hypothetical protein AAF927_13625 [Bacteroidota bacterium]